MNRPSVWGAGVEVVSTGPAPSSVGWRLAPDLTIGSSDSVVLERPTDIAVAPDGQIFVLDQLAKDVKVFRADGTFVRVLGRAGEGPGELTGMSSRVFYLEAGAVVVVDLGNGRLQYFGLDGGDLGSIPVDLMQGTPLEWGVVPGGNLVETSVEGPPQVLDTSDSIEVLFRELEATDGGARQLFRVDWLTTGGSTGRTLLFSPVPCFAILPSGNIVVGDGGAFQLTVLDRRGDPVLGIDRQYQSVRITSADKDRLLRKFAAFLVKSGLPPDVAQDVVEKTTDVADRYPAFVRILADDVGRIWVQLPSTVDEIVESPEVAVGQGTLGGPRWDVFDSEGHFVAEVPLPAEFHLRAIRGDSLYGHSETASGEPVIRRLQLIPSVDAP